MGGDADFFLICNFGGVNIFLCWQNPKNGKNDALGRYFFFLETIKILFRVSQSLSLFFRFSAYEKGKKDIGDRLWRIPCIHIRSQVWSTVIFFFLLVLLLCICAKGKHEEEEEEEEEGDMTLRHWLSPPSPPFRVHTLAGRGKRKTFFLSQRWRHTWSEEEETRKCGRKNNSQGQSHRKMRCNREKDTLTPKKTH